MNVRKRGKWKSIKSRVFTPEKCVRAQLAKIGQIFEQMNKAGVCVFCKSNDQASNPVPPHTQT